MKKALLLAILPLFTACAPRHCEQFYTHSCMGADKTREYLFGSDRLVPVVDTIIIKDRKANGAPLSGGVK